MEKIPQGSQELPRKFMEMPILSSSEIAELNEAKRFRAKELRRERYFRKKIAYIEGCICKCGKPKESGESLCQECIAKKEKGKESRKARLLENADRHREKMRQKKLAKMKETEKCYFCGEPVLSCEYRICPECRQKWKSKHIGEVTLGDTRKEE